MTCTIQGITICPEKYKAMVKTIQSKGREMDIAAIDIGSNAIRLVIATQVKNKSHKVLHKYRAPVRLGADVFNQGKISKENIAQLIQTFKIFQKVLYKHQVRTYYAAATSALREASNRDFVIAQIYKKTNIKIQLINGIEEANLIFSAVKSKINLMPHNSLLVDIGGGSVELTYAQKAKPISSKSFSLGTVRLIETLKRQNLKESDIPFLLVDSIPEIQTFISSLKHDFSSSSLCLVGTGGNVEAMGKLKLKILKKRPSSPLTLEELNQLIFIVRKIPLRHRTAKLGIKRDRADVILPAMMTIKLIMLLSRTNKITIPYVGLKDGLLNCINTNSNMTIESSSLFN